MAGTKQGGKAAAETNRRRYGKNYYADIGKIGGKLGRTGGFGNGKKGRELARIAGRKGGLISRRGTIKVRRDYEGTPDHLDVTDRRS